MVFPVNGGGGEPEFFVESLVEKEEEGFEEEEGSG